MLRTFKQINQDIQHCQKQIASTFENQTPQNTEEMEIVRQGFQIQLNKLNDERTIAINNIKVINPRIYTIDGLRQLDVSEHALDGMDQ